MLCPNETENEAEMEPAGAKESDQITLNANTCKCEASQAHQRVLSALGRDPSSPPQEQEAASVMTYDTRVRIEVASPGFQDMKTLSTPLKHMA